MTTRSLSIIMFLALLLCFPSRGWSADDVPTAARQDAVPGAASGSELTIILVDHLLETQQTASWEGRKQLLLSYSGTVRPDREIAVCEYEGEQDPAARAVGEAKARMVLHMLKRTMGAERFAAAQRAFIERAKFKQVSWADFREVFAKHADRDLGLFFAQWVDGKGVPHLAIEKAEVRRIGIRYQVSFDIVQEGTPYDLDLPVTVRYASGGAFRQAVQAGGGRKHITLVVDERPASLAVDDGYDVARMLTPAETAPTVGALLGAERTIVVPPPGERATHAAFIDSLVQQGAEERQAADLKNTDTKNASLVVLGRDNPAAARLFGSVEVPRGGFAMAVRRNPWNDRALVGIVQSASAGEATAAVRNLARAADCSRAVFEQGTMTSCRTDEARRGITMDLKQQTTAVDLSALETLDDIIEKASARKLVYVGEYHDRYAHHEVQLKVIQRLLEKDPKVIVGMEMFQRPFQSALDEYIAGAIDEREFLKRSEYFKRWGFDYYLYKPILDLCRQRKIPVVALNLRREITEKVSKGGLDSLSPEERSEIPAEMDFSDDAYRARLRSVFEQHRNAEDREFDFFYQAQVLWDETMAESVAGALRARPDHRMVVIAGGGHLVYGSGIPNRVKRRTGHDHAIIVNDVDVERGIADYLVYPAPVEGVPSPLLGVSLKESDGTVTVTGFAPESAGRKAGLRTGDVIRAADGEAVKDVGDLKLALFYKKSGEVISLNVERKRFLLGMKKLVVGVTL